MTAIRLVTQFDDPRRRALAVATPTCCSCCCCCCGVTIATSATLTAVHLNHTAAVAAPARRRMVTVAGAASTPVAVALLLLVPPIPDLLYGVRVALGALVVAAWLGSLAYLYHLGGHRRPWLPSLIAVAGTVVGMAAEFYLGLYTAGAGLLAEVFAIPVAIVAGIWLYRELKARRESGMGRA